MEEITEAWNLSDISLCYNYTLYGMRFYNIPCALYTPSTPVTNPSASSEFNHEPTHKILENRQYNQVEQLVKNLSVFNPLKHKIKKKLP